MEAVDSPSDAVVVRGNRSTTCSSLPSPQAIAMRQPRPHGTVASVIGSPSIFASCGKSLSAADGALDRGLCWRHVAGREAVG